MTSKCTLHELKSTRNMDNLYCISLSMLLLALNLLQRLPPLVIRYKSWLLQFFFHLYSYLTWLSLSQAVWSGFSKGKTLFGEFLSGVKKLNMNNVLYLPETKTFIIKQWYNCLYFKCCVFLTSGTLTFWMGGNLLLSLCTASRASICIATMPVGQKPRLVTICPDTSTHARLEQRNTCMSTHPYNQKVYLQVLRP